MFDDRLKAKSFSHAPELPTGSELLHDPILNKGTAFTALERDALRLRGLLPPRIFSQDEQMMLSLENVRELPTDLEKYIYLMDLQDRNAALFYRVIAENIEEMMPIIYTPTVGLACQRYGHIFRTPRGLFISARDKNHIAKILHNWPHDHVRVIVVTDGQRILGLGDLGAYGMGIPVGKLALYTACAGIHPTACLPIVLDVGTDNPALLKDPLYFGLQQERLRGAAYDELIEEFMIAVEEVFPSALIQFEDFATPTAFRLMNKYHKRICSFVDDIQGTGSVVLAGLLSAQRITDHQLADQRILFVGAGEAGIGAADLIVYALMREGMKEQEAREHCWFMDSKGLVVKSRSDLTDHKRPYAHDHAAITDLISAVKELRPTALIGVSGQPKLFTQPVIELMAQINPRPVIFALSNPTSKSECSALNAYTWSSGRAIFASGSPFEPVSIDGQTFVASQANNAYVFPGVGLGVITSETVRVTDEMFFAAAKALAKQVTEADLKAGNIYPPLSKIREVSAEIALAVADVSYSRGLAMCPKPRDLLTYVKAQMYTPDYQSYV